jgi:hypothetical protein
MENRSINDLERRLKFITSELDTLEKRKAALNAEYVNLSDLLDEMNDEWSKYSLENRLRKTILSRYGSTHNIKMAILDLNPVRGTNNDLMAFYPNLKFIDSSFKLMSFQTKIDVSDFAPTLDQVLSYEQKVSY